MMKRRNIIPLLKISGRLSLPQKIAAMTLTFGLVFLITVIVAPYLPEDANAAPDPSVPASTPFLTASTGLTDTDSDGIPNLNLPNASPASTGSVISGSMTIGAKTNNPTGYNLSLRTTSPGGNMVNTANSIYTIAPTSGTIASPAPLANGTTGTWGFAIPAVQVNPVGLTATHFDSNYTIENNNLTSTSKWAAVPTSNTIVKSTALPNAADDYTVFFYGAKVNYGTPSGIYKSNVVYTVITNDVPAPVITSVSPSSGSAAGGDTITITGTHFYNQASTVKVTVGGVDCTSYTVIGDTSITCVVPTHTAGTVDVTVTTISGGTATASGAYTYIFIASGWEKSVSTGNENFDVTASNNMIPIIVKNDPNKTWYNYSGQRWANMALVNPNKAAYYNSLPIGTELNDYDILGYFVWVPRFAYQITSGLHSSTTGNINVVFVDTSNKNGATTYSAAYPTTTATAMNDYVVHPSFTNGSANGFANGEWDSELTGYWVAKYKASHSDATSSNAGTSSTLTSKPNLKMWTSITVGSAASTSYNYDRNDDSHFMKSSEWGAVAYLTRSSYGKNGDVGLTTNTNLVTGDGNYAANTSQSTTGNIYGIYDMAGVSAERTASYVSNTTALGQATSGYGAGLVVSSTANQANQSTKYSTIYVVGTGGDSSQNNYAANGFSSTPKKFGDAIYETSSSGTGFTAWYGEDSTFPNTTNPYFNRGRGTVYGAYSLTASTGDPNAGMGFRPVLAPSKSGTPSQPTPILPEQIIISPGTDSSSQVRAAWYSDSASTASAIRVSTSSDMSNATTFTGSTATTTATPGKVSHKASASGLIPNTQYYYQVGDGQAQNWSSTRNFKTGPATSTPFTFIFASDIHIMAKAGRNPQDDSAAWANTLTKATTIAPDASIILSDGDNTDDLTNNATMKETEYSYFTAPLQSTNLVFATAMGNHDNNTAEFSNHFNQPDNPSSIGTSHASPGSVYSFTRGDALFIVLNTGGQDQSLGSSYSFVDLINAQLPWLRATVSASTAKWKIVLIHRTIYSVAKHMLDSLDVAAGGDGTRSILSNVFDELHIDLVLEGHDHTYVRTYPMKGNARVPETFDGIYSVQPTNGTAGTVYVQTNSAGRKQYAFAADTSPSNFYVAKKITTCTDATNELGDSGYTIININGNKLTLNFYSVTSSSPLDTYGIEKN